MISTAHHPWKHFDNYHEEIFDIRPANLIMYYEGAETLTIGSLRLFYLEELWI